MKDFITARQRIDSLRSTEDQSMKKLNDEMIKSLILNIKN